MGLWQWLLAVALTLVCALMIVVILLQRGRGGGLVGVFGGGGAGSAFGAKTGDVFTWITVALAGLFIFLSSIGNCAMEPKIPVRDRASLTSEGESLDGDINADLPPAAGETTPPTSPPGPTPREEASPPPSETTTPVPAPDVIPGGDKPADAGDQAGSAGESRPEEQAEKAPGPA